LQGDWSSDVCSSDLGIDEVRVSSAGAVWRSGSFADRIRYMDHWNSGRSSVASKSAANFQSFCMRLQIEKNQIGVAVHRQIRDIEIGRASCRERGEIV